MKMTYISFIPSILLFLVYLLASDNNLLTRPYTLQKKLLCIGFLINLRLDNSLLR